MASTGQFAGFSVGAIAFMFNGGAIELLASVEAVLSP